MSNDISNSGANLGNIEPINSGTAFGGLVNGLESAQVGYGNAYGTGHLNSELVYVAPEAGSVAVLNGERLTFVDYRGGEMVWQGEMGVETYTL